MKDLPPIGLLELPGSDGCDAALSRCLSPLLDALGWRGDDKQISEALPFQTGDLSLGDLINTMANLRYQPLEDQVHLDELRDEHFPSLFIDRDEKPYILIKQDGDQLLAYDGTASEYSDLPMDHQAGHIVFFKNMEDDSTALLQRQNNWFSRALSRFNLVFLWVFVASAFMSLLALMAPLLIMSIYGEIGTARSLDSLGMLGLGVVVFLTADTGFRHLRTKMLCHISVRMGNIVANQNMRRLSYLPPKYTETADLSSQISRIKDFETVREFFSGPAMTALADLPVVVVQLLAMIYLGGNLVWVPLFFMACFALIGILIHPTIKRITSDSSQAVSLRQELALDMLSSFAATKYLGYGEKFMERYGKAAAEAAYQVYRSAVCNSLINSLSAYFVSVTGLLTMTMGVYLVFDGHLLPGALMAVMILSWRTLAPMRSVFSVALQIQKIFRSIKQIDRLMNMEQEVRPTSVEALEGGIEGGIRLSKVTVRDANSIQPALMSIDMEVKPGELIVLCGHPSSGSTIIPKILLRMQDYQSGGIFLDDMNVRQLDPITLRSLFAFSPMDTWIYPGSLRDNLLLSEPSASEEDIERIVESLGLKAEIDALPSGLDTEVNNQMGSQSESFRKRLGLARMLLRNSKVLLLDRPDVGLTESRHRQLAEHLLRQKGKKTMIIVSNNPNFFEIADRAYWFDHGRIAQSGPPLDIKDAFYSS